MDRSKPATYQLQLVLDEVGKPYLRLVYNGEIVMFGESRTSQAATAKTAHNIIKAGAESRIAFVDLTSRGPAKL